MSVQVGGDICCINFDNIIHGIAEISIARPFEMVFFIQIGNVSSECWIHAAVVCIQMQHSGETLSNYILTRLPEEDIVLIVVGLFDLVQEME